MTATMCAILTASSPADPSVAMCLRQVVALVAGGARPRLLLASAQPIEDEALPDEVERYLDALAEFEVGPERVDGAQLKAALLASHHVLRAGDAQRTGVPAYLVLTDELLTNTDGETLMAWIRACGQVVRRP
jgi:hypothetical protein